MADLITTARKNAGITQDELANGLGWSNGQFVSNIERGIATVPDIYMKRLARILNIDPQLLIDARVCDLRIALENNLKKRK